VRYGLPDGRVRTVLTIAPNSVTRVVQGTGTLTEQIPLVLHPADQVSDTPTGLMIRRAGVTITIDWGTSLPAMLTATGVRFLRDGARRLHVLRIPHSGALTTTITLT
jgi:hypothetical protein